MKSCRDKNIGVGIRSIAHTYYRWVISWIAFKAEYSKTWCFVIWLNIDICKVVFG